MIIKESPGLYLQSPKLNQLNILAEVAADARITQAELAARCSLSAAMVNNYMKDFCGRDWIEYKRKSVKSVTYHLTPAGARHMEILQTELVGEMVEMFINAKELIRIRILNQSRSVLQRVVVYGCGHLAQIVFHSLETSDIRVLGVCDDDPKMIGKVWCGHEVIHPSQIRFIVPDAVIVADMLRTEEILRNLDSLSNDGVQLIRLDRGAELRPNAQPQSRMHSFKTAKKKPPVAQIRMGKAES